MRLRVRVPATTANVGSGFDCVGIALDWYDELTLDVIDEGIEIEVTGEGADQVPRDASHLVIATLRKGLEVWGGDQPTGLRLQSHNTIPHSRGLGSSAAAIAAGLTFAWVLSRGPALDLDEIARLASLIEGHADNAAAAVHGGATLGWIQDDDVTISPLRVHQDLEACVWVPSFEVPTKGARAVFPEQIDRLDAVAQAAAAARLMVALDQRPEGLLQATEDRLHQRFRASLMPSSHDLMERLRAAGIPAAISGAGPTVFAIGTAEILAAAADVACVGFRKHDLAIGGGMQLLDENGVVAR